MPKNDLEDTLEFKPRFGPDGLIPCIVTALADGVVLMFAWMNSEALQLTLETGEAYFYSRSRGSLWRKGESSGMVQKVREIRVDCDQDCIWMQVESGPACHTGRRSCFYRVVSSDGTLSLKDDQILFDPAKIYGS